MFFKKVCPNQPPSVFGFLPEWATAEKKNRGVVGMLYGEVSGVLYKTPSQIYRGYIKKM